MLEILIGERLISLASLSIWLIGRDKDCHIRIQDRTVSRRHATIYINEMGDATITDGDLITNKPSVNGVTINGVKLNFNHGQILQDGDVVELSPAVSFRFFSRKVEKQLSDEHTLL